MALAKHHEEIWERIVEDRGALSDRMLRCRDDAVNGTYTTVETVLRHAEAHLNTSEKLLDEIMNMLTTPEYQGVCDSAEMVATKLKNSQLMSRVFDLEEQLHSTEEQKVMLERKFADYDKILSENNHLQELNKFYKQYATK